MNDIYIHSRACLRSLNFKALSRLNLGHAFFYYVFICSDHEQELLKVLARCLCVGFSEISQLFILRVRCASGTLFLDYLPIVMPVVYCP